MQFFSLKAFRSVPLQVLFAGLSLCAQPAAAQLFNPFTRPDDEVTTKSIMVLMKIDGGFVEKATPYAFLEEKPTTLHDLIKLVDHAAQDEEVKAMAVQIQRPMMGLAQTTELRNAFQRYRDTDKELIMLMDIADLKGYYLASAGSKIVMTPVGGLMTYGLSFNLYFFRDMLEKIGLKAQVVNTGDFKNALEPFTNQEMSDGTRTQYMSLMEDITGSMGAEMGKSRGVEGKDLLSTLFTGPHLAPQALEKNLITDADYFEDFLDQYAIEHGLEQEDDYSPFPKKREEIPNIFTMFSAASAGTKPVNKKPKVALIFAQGAIVDGSLSKEPFADTNMIASDSFIELLDEAVEENAKVIVLRVDSGGGSAVASDRIWQKLKTIREEKGIPVVVSMGNVAASGGYYISMGANRIFVLPTTITGSIGVIAGRVIMGDLYTKIGVNRQAISMGANSWLEDETTAYTPEQVAFVETLILQTYEDFTSKAAASRGMAQADIKELAGGRVWSGVSAVNNGLADEIGGLKEAVAYAQTLAEGDDDLPVVEYPKEKSLSDLINDMMAGTVSTQRLNNQALAKQVVAQWEGVLPESAVLSRFLGTLMLLSENYQVLAVEPLLVDVN